MTPEADLNGPSVRTHNPDDAPKQPGSESEIRARARVGHRWIPGQARLAASIRAFEAALPGWTADRHHIPPAAAWRAVTPAASQAPELHQTLWLAFGGFYRAVVTTVVWAVSCTVATQKRAAVFGLAFLVLSVAYWLTH